jgi:hypothetical protein
MDMSEKSNQLSVVMLSVKNWRGLDAALNPPRLGSKQRKTAPPEVGKEPLIVIQT